jgi:hypothetical protein
LSVVVSPSTSSSLGESLLPSPILADGLSLTVDIPFLPEVVPVVAKAIDKLQPRRSLTKAAAL